MAQGRRTTGGTIWQVRVVTPVSWRKVLLGYKVEHDKTVQDIVVEALREWAQRRGVELPSVPQ